MIEYAPSVMKDVRSVLVLASQNVLVVGLAIFYKDLIVLPSVRMDFMPMSFKTSVYRAINHVRLAIKRLATTVFHAMMGYF